MFRIRDPQESLWQSQFLVTPKKAKRLERSWAEVFRNEALPLIDEERFAPMYCVDNGRPNRAVQTVLGVHLLKEMFNLTDDEALEQLEFNLLWHHALRLDIEETHLPQKTLHNFRVRLMQHDGGRLAFQETTDRIIQALGIRTGKQRLDSTHIMSNIATLTRLGLFCETMRLFLRALRWEHPELRPGVPEGLLGRYLKEEDEATHYEDARTGEGRRRLSVCARDLYRLVDRFHGTTAAQQPASRGLLRSRPPSHARAHLKQALLRGNQVIGPLPQYDLVAPRNNLYSRAFLDAPLLGDGLGNPDGQARAPLGDKVPIQTTAQGAGGRNQCGHLPSHSYRTL